MTNKYLQSIREYIFAIICAILFSITIPTDSIQSIQNVFIYFLSLIPLTTPSLLLVNLGTMILILICGLKYIESVSFFIVLNGIAFGIILAMYKATILTFISLVFPHSIFETSLMIIYCSQVKFLSKAYKQKDHQQIKYSWQIIFFVCIPLWLFSGILEGSAVNK